MAERENEQRLQFCRDILICLSCGRHGHVDPAHIRVIDSYFGKNDAGMGLKPYDVWTVPLCRPCHDAQHRTSEAKYWGSIGFDLASMTHSPLVTAGMLTLYYLTDNLEGAREYIKHRTIKSMRERHNWGPA
jgi:hypothetical protein